jgi:hypothetical protein
MHKQAYSERFSHIFINGGLSLAGGVEMKAWSERIIEKLLVNTIWLILKAICIAGFSFTFIWISKRLASGINPYFLSTFIFSTFIAAIWFLRCRFGTQYPRFRWDVVHGKNKYILSFKSREEAEYTRKIEAIPLREDTKSFPEGEYVWTGDISDPKIVEQDSFTLEMSDDSCGSSHKYFVKPKNTIKPYNKQEYTIFVSLQDKGLTMVPQNCIYIKRPTQSITLELMIPKDIPIKNVRFRARAKYGEERVLIDKKGILTQSGGHTIGACQYIFKVSRPKMFCEYEICWEWDKNTNIVHNTDYHK